jgi:hypothetical protein
MASALRVKNTAYFDIAVDLLHERILGIDASPVRLRLCAHHWTDKPADPVLAAKIRFGGNRRIRARPGSPSGGTVALSRNVPGKPSNVEALLHGRAPRKGRTSRPCP